MVGITIDQISKFYPRLYHMAEYGTWNSIQKHGLLSTTALLDLFEISGKQREQIESQHRPECVTIKHDVHGVAVIRDQKPMRESTLLKCLDGITPKKWYELLNRRTFFWLSELRLTGLLQARAYRDKAHCVITVDTRLMLERHFGHITLSPINSGSTIYNPPKRNAATFYRPADYPFEERRKLRGIANAIAELSVDYAVPDICDFVVSVEHRQEKRLLKRIWPVRVGS